MIKFKILCLICLCFVLSKVIGVEKFSDGYRTADQSTSSSKKVDNLMKQTTKQPVKQSDQSKEKREEKRDEKVKKNEKIKLKDEQFQVLKGGSDLQLQKNSVQNSFQAVYGQAFIIDDPVSKAFEKTKSTKAVTLPKSQPVQPNKPPATNPVKPKESPPIYPFNRRAIVYQCCRYVFPAELYYDHLLFYSKYGQTYSSGENAKPAGHQDRSLGRHIGHHTNHHINHLGHQPDNQQGNQLGDQVSHLPSQLSDDLPRGASNKKELEKETVELTADKAKANEKLVGQSNGRKAPIGSQKRLEKDYSGQPSSKSEQPNESEEDLRGDDERSNERSNEKSNEKSNGKSNEKASANDEPDEAATNLFRTWSAHNKQLYNFGSCTPIYDLSQTGLQGGRNSRWHPFG